MRYKDLRYFLCHLSPVLNAICHVGKSPGMILMTGKCFQEIEPSFSALTLQGNKATTPRSDQYPTFTLTFPGNGTVKKKPYFYIVTDVSTSQNAPQSSRCNVLTCENQQQKKSRRSQKATVAGVRREGGEEAVKLK